MKPGNATAGPAPVERMTEWLASDFIVPSARSPGTPNPNGHSNKMPTPKGPSRAAFQSKAVRL